MAIAYLRGGREQRVLQGNPWVFRSDIDRVSGQVEPGDVVTSLNGTPTDSVQAFKRLESQGASAPVIQLHRRGQPMTVLLKNP